MKIVHKIKLSVKNAPTQQYVPVSFGCPFPKGLVTSEKQLQLCDQELSSSKATLPFSSTILNRWPDGSIKWLELSFALYPNYLALSLLVADKPIPFKQTIPAKSIIYTEEDSRINIVCNEQRYYLSSHSPTLPSLCVIDEDTLGLNIFGDNNTSYNAVGLTNDIVSSTDPHSGHCLKLTVKTMGSFNSADKHPELSKLRFSVKNTFIQDSPFIQCEIEIHNTQAAEHVSGQWDLGDKNSVKLKAVKLPVKLENPSALSLLGIDCPQQNLENYVWSIAQHSSGGENWQSPNHVDQSNNVPLAQKGGQITVDGNNVADILRPNPWLMYKQGDVNVGLAIENFWQTFPNQISYTNKLIELDLLPELNGIAQELQGGEKLTKIVWLSTSKTTENNLDWVFNKPVIHLDKDWYQTCDVIDNLSLNLNASTDLADLLQLGLSATNNFFSKREQIDEYGWRNFGDLFADHETAGYDGDELFISHYNNQYDPLYGFIRQYLATGKAAWLTLANDLAHHVKNIDIYHTTNDKAEYNGGLFWHTDHYVKAYTSSHRSYSKRQESDVYQDHAGGGGPGGQHCYTTGLTYHYLLTGDVSSKQAVLTLSQWICNVYDGTDTLFELLLGIKNRHVPGLKNHLTGQYPFDRGTANLLVALLDSYELTQEITYLTRAEHVIKNTIHPNDVIENRDLKNVEFSWFYTVFLQAVTRYLDVKRKSNQLDSQFYYARDALLHYAQWIVAYESPYLENPEILEFPNDTWTAQDLRKAAVLAAAWYYGGKKNDVMLQKASFFQDYVVAKLSDSSEKTYTRVLALLMQNSGTLDYYLDADALPSLQLPKYDWPLAPYMKTGMVNGFFQQLFKRLKSLSVSNEYRWLMKRLGK
ncbi:hypothetical protein [Paraglaciecola sp.]|uniref:RIFT barrel domain-containing protein n=1 Tax=Paraglaciecola sp. TaxID=1920173 RepID=UPI00273D030E|nr:hypothetical protein [Paraglaciecola sp.]MDP5031418.1 hypothetical protein [Paraglaciecola sp.]